MGVGDPNCNCPQCVAYREEERERKSKYVVCEHLVERYNRKEGPGWEPDWKQIRLSPEKTVVLCGLCHKALAYDFLTEFNRLSSRPYPQPYGR